VKSQMAGSPDITSLSLCDARAVAKMMARINSANNAKKLNTARGSARLLTGKQDTNKCVKLSLCKGSILGYYVSK